MKLGHVVGVVLLVVLPWHGGLRANQIYQDAVGYWQMGESGGSLVASDSIGGYDGSLVNMSGFEWGPGRVGTGLSLDGVNDHVRVNDTPALDVGFNDFSVSGWIQTSSPANHYLFNKGGHGSNNGLSVWMTTSQQLRFNFRTSSGVVQLTSTTSGLDDSNWHHFTFTADRDGNATVYLDGNAETFGGMASAAGFSDVANNLYFGSNSGTAQFLNASLDEFAFWRRTLLPGEADALFRTGYMADAVGGLGLNLGYTAEEINQLAYLYHEAKYNGNTGYSVLLNGINWTYTDTAPAGAPGNGYQDLGGTYHIHVGDGLMGVAIPEPGSAVLLCLGGLMTCGVVRRRRKLQDED